MSSEHSGEAQSHRQHEGRGAQGKDKAQMPRLQGATLLRASNIKQFQSH